jgi:single-stranded DNA-binding protein
MTLHAAVYGQAFKDAEVKESKSGSQYGSALITVPNGTDEEGRDQHLFIRLLTFQENVDELGKVKRGDRLYAEGALSISIYQSDKGPRPDLTLKAHHLRQTQIGKDLPRRERESDAASVCFGGGNQKPKAQDRPDYWRDELPM